MDSKVTYALVGLFVVLLGAALVGGIVWLTSGGLSPRYDRYLVYYADSVSGLSVDAAVRYKGVRVGRVAGIELAPRDPERVRILLEVAPDTPVKTDTVATLEMQGLTGLAYVNLLGGTREAPRLAATPGEEYPVIPSRPSLIGRMDRAVSELLSRLTETSRRMNALLSDENRGRLEQILDDAGRVAADTRSLTETLASRRERIAGAIDDLATTLDKTREATVQVTAQVPLLVKELKESADAIDRMAENIGATSSELRRNIAATGNETQRFAGETLPQAAAAVDELREAARNFRMMSESLAKDPSVLIYGAPTPERGPGE